jgi:hypothetical protein
MISKDWRRRFKTLSERLDSQPVPSMECQFALEKFREIQSPKPMDEFRLPAPSNEVHYRVPEEGPDINAALTQVVEKGLDLGIMADILLRK